MLSESKGALKADYTSPRHKLTPLIKRQFQENKSRIIVAMYSQNLFGIQEVINLGIETNKKILVLSKDMQNLMDSFSVEGLLEIPKANKATIQDLKNEDQSDLLVLVTGTGEKLFRILQTIGNEELSEEKGLVFNEKTY